MSLLLIFAKASKTEIRSWHGTQRHNLGGCSFRECNLVECQEEEIMITEHSRTVVARESTRPGIFCKLTCVLSMDLDGNTCILSSTQLKLSKDRVI